jgi:DNA-binding winged helix-turn-helix (wHTH) protein
LLRLRQLIELGVDPLPRQVEELRRRDPPLPIGELRQALLPLAVTMLRAAAATMAAAMGCELDTLLRFCDPDCTEAELRGTRAVQHRVDRRWGGAPIIAIEARVAMAFHWPAPLLGHIIGLHGRVERNGVMQAPYGYWALKPGDVLGLEAGSAVLVRRSPAASILDATLTAGFAVKEVIAACCGHAPALATAGGSFHFHGEDRTVVLNGRTVRLTAAETRTLQLLLQQPGATLSRQEMIQRLGLGNPRALDHIILSLRDKLGDGLISTVYGAGYALEAQAAAATVSSRRSARDPTYRPPPTQAGGL